MTLSTLCKYLIGNRQAILDIAASRRSVFVGLLLVLAAGLAREYDGEDLWSEPWHLLLPLGASLATSALLYILLKVLLWLRGGEADGRKLSYQELLSLYWMTAPLALLYGIPFERFLSAGEATRANLALLGIVSLWRVLLMARAISALYGVPFLRALCPVMLFADTVALTLLSMTPIPIIGIMGGIRLSESESLIHVTAWTIGVLGTLSWPIWFGGAIASVQSTWQLACLREQPPRPIAFHLWLVGVLAIGVWLPVLPAAQSEQRLRRATESELRSDQIREALERMSAHERSDYPPHWDPPPRIAYREKQPDIMEVMAHLDVLPVKDWVRQIYWDKFGNSLRGESFWGVWLDLPDDEIERRISILEQMPDRNRVVKETQRGLEMKVDHVPQELRERVEKLLKDAGLRSEPAQRQVE